MQFSLTTTAFPQGGKIPSKYTCDGTNTSPQLIWTDPPEGVRSFALIVEDPDAPSKVWSHWVLYNIPENISSLPEGIKDLGLQGMNDFGTVGYSGPCPPSGTHHYFFKLFALDCVLQLQGSVDKKRLEEAMRGHILGQAELMGAYARTSS